MIIGVIRSPAPPKGGLGGQGWSVSNHLGTDSNPHSPQRKEGKRRKRRKRRKKRKARINVLLVVARVHHNRRKKRKARIVARVCWDVCCATRHVGLGRLPTIAHKTSARCGRATRDTPRRPSYKRKSYRSPLMQDGALLSLGAKAHGACAYFADIDVMPPHINALR